MENANGDAVYDIDPPAQEQAQARDEKAEALKDLRDIYAKMRASQLFTNVDEMNARGRADKR